MIRHSFCYIGTELKEQRVIYLMLRHSFCYIGTELKEQRVIYLMLRHSFLLYRYKAQGAESNLTNAKTFFLLLDLLTFFDCFHDGKMDEALKVSKSLLIIYTVKNYLLV